MQENVQKRGRALVSLGTEGDVEDVGKCQFSPAPAGPSDFGYSKRQWGGVKLTEKQPTHHTCCNRYVEVGLGPGDAFGVIAMEGGPMESVPG